MPDWSKKTEREFEGHNSIDPLALDLECIRQAELFSIWARRAVEAKELVESASLKASVVEAELERRCREDPQPFGLEKVTEGGVKAAVKSHKKFVAARKELIRARTSLAMYEQAERTLEMKKRMLEKLVDLHGQSYYAGPSVPRNLGEIVLAQRERSKERTRKRTKLRKRKESK